MPLKTKAKIASIGEALGKKSKEFTFIDPPMIDAPNTTILKLNGAPRQLPDPSLTLKPAMGIERIDFNSIDLVNDEKLTDGAPIHQLANKDPRIRFFGDVKSSNFFGGSKTGSAVVLVSTLNQGFEVTYFGTGINLMIQVAAVDSRFMEVEVDGVAQSNIVVGSSPILNVRSTKIRSVYNAIKGQTLGIHTAKFTIGNIGSLGINGIEILNESAQIQVPQGEIFAAGNKYVNDTLTAIDYNAGFEGSPTLNGRGGRVSIYMTPEGKIKKAIQQVDSAQANLAAADHSNEEVIRKINFREFGANRADDFSTLTTSTSDRSFSLDDGTTTLVANDAQAGLFGTATEEGLLTVSTGTSFWNLTFVGTGLDLVENGNVATLSALQDLTIDGVTVAANFQPYLGTAGNVIKIVSGLPYGTHTVQMARQAGANGGMLSDFIVYGPKKPEIPADAQEISNYYLMADYDGSTANGTAVADHLQRPTGVLQKVSERELVYSGTWFQAGGVSVNNPSGFFINTSTLNDFYEYTFSGTGIVIQHASTVSGTYSFEVQIDGVANDTGVALSNVSNDGSGNYSTTVATSDVPARLEFTGLSNSSHTVRVTLKTASRNMGLGALHVITPTHFPNTKAGSLSMGPGVQLQKETSSSNIDLTKAKAFLKYQDANATILEVKNSMNVSAIVEVENNVYEVYFERPFKDAHYIVVGAARGLLNAGNNGDGRQFDVVDQKPGSVRVGMAYNSGSGDGNTFVGTTNGTDFFNMVIFGELADEGDE